MHAFGAHIEVVSEEMATVLRQKTGAERLAIADRMFSSARRMLLNHLRSEHPEWDEHEREREAARRLSDTAYINQWADTLGLADVWRAILDRLREP